jgi:hypothetical protein
VWRAQIVLLSAAGVGTNEIMRQTGKSKTCVWRWLITPCSPPYGALLRCFHMLGGGDRTGWLGWQDSKLCIPNDRIEPEGFRGEAEKG